METILAQVNDWKDLVPLMGVLFLAHRQAMKKLDELIVAQAESGKLVAVHDNRISEAEKDIEAQGKSIHKLNNEVHGIKNKLLTADTVTMMIENEIIKAK